MWIRHCSTRLWASSSVLALLVARFSGCHFEALLAKNHARRACSEPGIYQVRLCHDAVNADALAAEVRALHSNILVV